MTETLYKVLRADGVPVYGLGVWNLPHDNEPGEWMPKIAGSLVPCKNGYHLCRREDLVRHLSECVYTAEYSGEYIDSVNEIVVRRARLLAPIMTWTHRTARLFACDCAERVLAIYEQHYDDDQGPRNAIASARRYAIGDAAPVELAAARAAVWNAAWDAVWDTAMDNAAGNATMASIHAAGEFVAIVPEAAAWAAAEAAAGLGTETKERAWQTARLFEYLEATR